MVNVKAIKDIFSCQRTGDAPKSQKHEQILAAGYDEFIGQGFGATSMDRIARTANVSKATLYAYFSSKEDLFAAIISTKCREVGDRLGEIDLASADPRRVLRELGKILLEIMISPEGIAMFRLVVAEAYRFPDLSRIFYDTGPKIMNERIAEVFTRLGQRGVLVIDNPETAGIQFCSILKGHLHTCLLLGLTPAASRQEIDDLIETTTDLMMKAYASA